MADDHKPTKKMAANAEKGLKLREKFDRGGTDVGVKRAQQIADGDVAMGSRDILGRPAMLLADIRPRAGLQQQEDDAAMSVGGGEVQRRGASSADGFNLAATIVAP